MAKRKNPDTSLEAYHSLDPVKISEMHKKIARAVKALGSGNYEAIALYLGVAESKVWKRLKEAQDAGLIFKTGETVLTKSNCKSYVYACVGEKVPAPVRKPEKSIKGKSVSDYSRELIKPQPTLF